MPTLQIFMKPQKQPKSVRTTVYLNHSIKNKIDELVKKHLTKNQTDFINQSLQNAISDLEKEITIQKLIKKIQNIKTIKPSKTRVELVQELRNERLNRFVIKK
jgi:Arc/MetJ-type ribon-helix-helix transcriptional regulator